MSNCLCDICKEKPAMIQITGKGKYCLDCHNDIVLRKYGIDNTFHYAPTMAVMEPYGKIHTFKIEHVILGSIVSWDATEINGDYHFKEISDIRANGTAVARQFFQKIVDGVCTKTLDELCCTTLIPGVKRTCCTMHEKGTIYISEDSHGRCKFIVDGAIYTGEELAEFFSSYSGFMVQYQIRDASEPILKADEYLMPVKITQQSLISELNMAIKIHGDRGFISYKATSAFDDAFLKITDKLEVLYHSANREDAIVAGREMVRILADTETDDDYFPRYDIEVICSIVDPFGEDEVMRGILQEWEDRF